jgi:acyl-coenzyme A synthetase/AMP-(fatty) acid ligase
MVYSSGTTGRPKGVKPPLSGAPFGTPPGRLAVMADRYGFGAGTVYLSTAPLYHAGPLRFAMTPSASAPPSSSWTASGPRPPSTPSSATG